MTEYSGFDSMRSSSCSSWDPHDVTHLIVVGGEQRGDAVSREEWSAFQAGRVVLVDLRTGVVTPLLRYSGDPRRLADGSPSVLFKSSTLTRHALWLCTTTEILRVGPRDWQIEKRVSHPWLNDVHHVVPTAEGTLLVANTGLDQVLELDLDGQAVAAWSTASTPTWERFDRAVDYRKIATTKPHHSHPNYVWHADGRWWVTRYLTGDACEVGGLGSTRRLSAVPREPESKDFAGPHDGVVWSDRVWFTTVDGHVVRSPAKLAADVDSNVASEELDRVRLVGADDGPELLGWCRGIAPVDANQAWIGFSRLRPTKFMGYLSWVKHGFRKVGQYATAPTRIALHDLTDGRLSREIDLEPAGMSTIFSLHPWSDSCCGESFPLQPFEAPPRPTCPSDSL